MEMTNNFANIVAETCYEQYASLPKTGKPQENKEWTLLACVVKVVDCEASSVQVVALGTGSKCIGQSKMSTEGDIVNDSHAEVMARRGFLRYLYHQLLVTYQKEDSDVFVLDKDTGKCQMKDGVSFHFFTSHTPCGDASIIPKSETSRSENLVSISSTKRKNSCEEIPEKRKKLEIVSRENHSVNSDKSTNIASTELFNNGKQKESSAEVDTGDASVHSVCDDIHRTGAKCLPGERQDPHLPGVQYHCINVLRTKPGRGDRTLSLSCSDKMAKWNVVGIQGALLSLFMTKPVYMQSFVVGLCPFSVEVVQRSLVERCSVDCSSLPDPYKINKPCFLQASIPFADGRSDISCDGNSKRPCASSIVWMKVPQKPLEVAVEGRKQGVTKKAQRTQAGCLSICKKELLKEFVELVQNIKSDYVPEDVRQFENLSKTPYCQLKASAKDYQRVWKFVKEISFPSWLKKPEMLLQFNSDG